MKKLELKHLAPYLPYDIKCKVHKVHNIKGNNIKILKSIINKDCGGFDFNNYYFDEFKPILRPLSDLTKNEFTEDFGEWVGKFDGIDVNNITFSTAQKLFKYHFDVFGLIPKKLAIDINTLKN